MAAARLASRGDLDGDTFEVQHPRELLFFFLLFSAPITKNAEPRLVSVILEGTLVAFSQPLSSSIAPFPFFLVP